MNSIKEKRRETVKSIEYMEGIELLRIQSVTEGIAGMGYDALFAILEVKLPVGEVWWFYNVPEDIWYKWRETQNKTAFFHTHIEGKYKAERVK